MAQVIEIKPVEPTEQHYMELFGWAKTHAKLFQLRWPDWEDAVQHVIMEMPQIWKYWEPSRSPWAAFAYLCSKRKIMDWLRVNYSLTRGYRHATPKYYCRSRVISVQEFIPEYREGPDYEENKIFQDKSTFQKNPADNVIISEFLEQLYAELTPMEQEQYHKLEQFPYVNDHRCLKNQTKREDNCRERIKRKAVKLLSKEDREKLKRDRKLRLKRGKQRLQEHHQCVRYSRYAEQIPIRHPRREE
jgi:hypothetical protein